LQEVRFLIAKIKQKGEGRVSAGKGERGVIAFCEDPATQKEKRMMPFQEATRGGDEERSISFKGKPNLWG